MKWLAIVVAPLVLAVLVTAWLFASAWVYRRLGGDPKADAWFPLGTTALLVAGIYLAQPFL